MAVKTTQGVIDVGSAEMGDTDTLQPVTLQRSVGSTSLNDTFDLNPDHHHNGDQQFSLSGDDLPGNSDDEEDSDDWFLQEELAKLKEEWDDYVENLEGQLDFGEYSPVDMKERLRQLNEEWGAEEVVERKNTKVNFSEQLVTLEVPPPEYPDEDEYNDSEGEGRVDIIEPSVEGVMEKENGAGDTEQDIHIQDEIVSDVKGKGDSEGDLAGLYAKQLNVTNGEQKSEETVVMEKESNEVKGQSNENHLAEEDTEKIETVTPEITTEVKQEDKNSDSGVDVNLSPPQKKEEQVLIERDGKFELKKVSELSAEERNIMGITLTSDENQASESGTDSQPSEGVGSSKGDTPVKKERPSTATTYQPPQRKPVQKRRIQSAKSSNTSYETSEEWRYNKPEGRSNYGLSPEQKEHKKKQMMLKSQRLEEKRQREEEEKKKQQEEAEAAFQAWVKRKQQEAVEKRKQEKLKKKEETQKTQKDPKEAEETYEAWLKSKKEQAKLERKVNRKKKKEEKEAYFYRSRDECDAAFKEWLKTKNKQLKEEQSMKRSAAVHTSQTAQKSRKARNLSKALQVAQTYQYTDYYGYRF